MESIGDILRAAREEKKIPIVQVARDTKVSERYIAAMEANEFSSLPALAYAKGFLRLYAEYLDLDPKPLVDQLLQESGSRVTQGITGEEEVLRPSTLPVGWRYSAMGVGGALVIIVLLLSGVMLMRSCAKTRSSRAAVPSGIEELETLPLPVALTVTPVPPPSPEASRAEEPVPRQKKLVAKAKENVMVKVYADGSLLFHETIRRGKEEFWLARESFDVRVAKPRAVELTLNGRPVKELKGREAQNIFIDKDGKTMAYRGKMRSE